jgi:hypothetical protein
MKEGQVSPRNHLGHIRTFFGIQSGRTGTAELKAQFGIAWEAQVIEEILDGDICSEV